MIQNWGWRYGFLMPISVAIGCTLIPLGRIYMSEQKEINARKLLKINEAI
jgi:hypothetical protein